MLSCKREGPRWTVHHSSYMTKPLRTRDIGKRSLQKYTQQDTWAIHCNHIICDKRKCFRTSAENICRKSMNFLCTFHELMRFRCILHAKTVLSYCTHTVAGLWCGTWSAPLPVQVQWVWGTYDRRWYHVALFQDLFRLHRHHHAWINSH